MKFTYVIAAALLFGNMAFAQTKEKPKTTHAPKTTKVMVVDEKTGEIIGDKSVKTEKTHKKSVKHVSKTTTVSVVDDKTGEVTGTKKVKK